MCGHREKIAIYIPRRKDSEEINLAITLTSKFSLQNCERIKLFSKIVSVWYIVIAGLANHTVTKSSCKDTESHKSSAPK